MGYVPCGWSRGSDLGGLQWDPAFLQLYRKRPTSRKSFSLRGSNAAAASKLEFSFLWGRLATTR